MVCPWPLFFQLATSQVIPPSMPWTLLVHGWHSPGSSQNGSVKATRQTSVYRQPFFFKGNIVLGHILPTESIELDIVRCLLRTNTNYQGPCEILKHKQGESDASRNLHLHLWQPASWTLLWRLDGSTTGQFNSSEVGRAWPPASHAPLSVYTGFQDSLTTCFLCFQLIWSFISSRDQLESELSLLGTNNKIITL